MDSAATALTAIGYSTGHVRVYSYIEDPTLTGGGQWTQVGEDINGESKYDESGHSVSLSSDGKTAAIGAPRHGWSNSAGQVRVYTYNNQSSPGQWTQLGRDMRGSRAGSWFGFSVSLSDDGRTVAIGAPFSAYGNQVRVRTYDETKRLWIPLGEKIN